MLDNIEVALLTKVNQLAEQCGLKIYDFQSRIVPDPEHDTYAITFSEAITPDPQKRERYARMLSLIGVAGCGRTEGDYVGLIDRMDDALRRAQRERAVRPLRDHHDAAAPNGASVISR